MKLRMLLFSRIFYILVTIGLSGLRTIGPSDYHTFGLSGLRTIGPFNIRSIRPSDYRTFGLSNLRTIGPFVYWCAECSDYQTFGLSDLRTIGPSDYRTFGLSGGHPYQCINCKAVQEMLYRLGKQWVNTNPLTIQKCNYVS